MRALRTATLTLALSTPLALGCTASRKSLGNVTLRSSGPSARSTTFGVEERHLFSAEVEAALDEKGCVRGLLGSDRLQLCPQAQTREAAVPGNVVQRWSGASGEFTIELEDGGRALRMDGFLRMGGRSLPLMATLPLGAGSQWDELRRHPELLAVAAAVARVGSEPDHNDLSRSR